MVQSSETSSAFEIKFTSREVSAWGAGIGEKQK